MALIVVTCPGMGKSTFVKDRRKDYELGECPFIDFDFKSNWNMFSNRTRYELTRSLQCMIQDGAEVVFVNPAFFNPDAIDPSKADLAFIFPKDKEALKARLIDRDGDDRIANDLDVVLAKLESQYTRAVKRFGAQSRCERAEAEYVDEYVNDYTGEKSEPHDAEPIGGTEEQMDEPEPSEEVATDPAVNADESAATGEGDAPSMDEVSIRVEDIAKALPVFDLPEDLNRLQDELLKNEYIQRYLNAKPEALSGEPDQTAALQGDGDVMINVPKDFLDALKDRALLGDSDDPASSTSVGDAEEPTDNAEPV